MYYQIEISETAANNTREEKHLFNTEHIKVETLNEVRTVLVERYGKVPGNAKRPNIYMDGPQGQSVETGFTVSFWNKDLSHNSKAWHQTDWITIYQVEKTAINPRDLYTK